MKKTDVQIANICFRILSIGQDSKVTIQVTQVSWSSDRGLVERIFVVPIEFPYSKVRMDTRGFDHLDYTLIQSMVFDESDQETEFNARIDIKSDGTIKLLGVTHAHRMFNALKNPHKHHQNRPINSMAAALNHASALSSGGGASDGDESDMDHVSNDPRTTQRKVARAPRPAKKKGAEVAA